MVQLGVSKFNHYSHIVPSGKLTGYLFLKGQGHQGIFSLHKGHPIRKLWISTRALQRAPRQWPVGMEAMTFVASISGLKYLINGVNETPAQKPAHFPRNNWVIIKTSLKRRTPFFQKSSFRHKHQTSSPKHNPTCHQALNIGLSEHCRNIEHSHHLDGMSDNICLDKSTQQNTCPLKRLWQNISERLQNISECPPNHSLYIDQ